MVVSVGMRLREGPWGGGNQFGAALAEYLGRHGVAVVFDLARPDIDIILLTEPRRELEICAFDDRDIAAYRARVNPRVLVVHRVNECDERKGTTGVNARLREANAVADATVFISSWLLQLHVSQGMAAPERHVILNGANPAIFHPRGARRWDRQGPLRLVTHHWGGNRRKGFDVYERIDAMLAAPALRKRLIFTYIGNLPAGTHMPNTRIVAPLHGEALAAELRSHHVYVTASENEPAGMHHIEGAACGLPLLFKRSGALPEYCSDFGIGFDGDDFPEALSTMMTTYHVWADRAAGYPHTSERMGDEYLALFTSLLRGRKDAVHAAPAISGEALTAWANDTVAALPGFLAQLRDPAGTARYAPARTGVLPTGKALSLGFTSLAVKLHAMLGTWRALRPEDQLMHTEFVRSFQREDSGPGGEWTPGAFVDPPLVRHLNAERKSTGNEAGEIGHVVRAESKQAIATLAEVLASPRMRYTDLPSTPNGARAALQSLNWRRPWEAGGRASAIVTLLAMGHGSATRQEETALLDAARRFFSDILDPATGAYFTGPRPEHGDLINGAMKVLTALAWLREPVHAPEALIDSCLSAQPSHEGCHLVDAAYVLYRCATQSSHRSADVRAYAAELLEMIRLHHSTDGGFSYWIGKSQTSYYGVPITSGMAVGDIHGTVLLTWAMAMMMRLMNDRRMPVLNVIQP